MIPDEYTRIAKPLVEIRGLGESELIRNCFLKELHFCYIQEVDNFGMLQSFEKSSKAESKQFNIELEWFQKYLNCVSSCWLEVFHFSPLDSIDSQISEDITVGNKFAMSKNKRYLPVIVCPDQNAFAARLSQIKASSRASILVCEGSDDANALSNVVKFVKDSASLFYKEISKKYRKWMTTKLSQFVGPWACKCFYQFKIGFVEELALDITTSTKYILIIFINRSYHQAYMALIDEGDKKIEHEFILYAQFIKSHADCLLMKMILGMNRLGSFKEGDLFFQGHLDWFAPCTNTTQKREKHEWLAEIQFKRGMVLENVQKTLPVSQNPGQSFFYAAQEYLELLTLEVDTLSHFMTAIKKAIYFFDIYKQPRHLEWARFLMNKLSSEPLEDISATSWPLIAENRLSLEYESSQNPLKLWELASLNLERFKEQLIQILLQPGSFSTSTQITSDKMIRCRIKYAYQSLEAGKPITCILRIHNQIFGFPLTLSSVKIIYIGSSSPHEILRNTIQFNDFYELQWQVLVQKSGKFGIETISMKMVPSELELVFNKQILFKK